ncbi:MAG: phosphoribosylformylglycinamidine synthase I [Methanomassiliicoccales archaeon]
MKEAAPRVCVLRMEGTNMSHEMAVAAEACGFSAETVHIKQLEGRCEQHLLRHLMDYEMLIIPGGFSAGDYVRAGAIFASRLRAMGRELTSFIDDGRLVLGVCNGFQVLVELGLLPQGGEKGEFFPRAALATNLSARYECRPAFMKNINRGKCIFTSLLTHGQIVSMPTAHAEGRFLLPPEKSASWIAKLEEEDQMVFSYCTPDGKEGVYPWNPSGTTRGIAALTNDTGTVLGMMPHPERAFWRIQSYDWTSRGSPEERADGSLLFEAAFRYLSSHF